MQKIPAVLGGPPAFARQIPVTRPTLRVDDDVLASMRAVLESGMTTNATEVAAFEREVADYLGVGHVVAVSSCTTGLMLLLQALGVRGEVVVPSFTFMASGHAVRWNGLPVTFADVAAETWTLDGPSLDRVLGPTTGAVLAVHTFGAPAPVEELERICAARDIPLIVDSAHGFGARYPSGSMVGSGATAEVFSLSPTKPFSAGEGGLITTNDGSLAAELRLAREYGNPGDYDSRFAGLNGRMPELSAVVGRATLRDFPGWIERRRGLAGRYAERLVPVPGLTFQRLPQGALGSHKDLVVRVDPAAFGLNRAELSTCLHAENISTRHYFDPPLHRQTAYRSAGLPGPLPVTDRLSEQALTLPLYSHMRAEEIDRIADAIWAVHSDAGRLRDRVSDSRSLAYGGSR